jgi:hypothetical protein
MPQSNAETPNANLPKKRERAGYVFIVIAATLLVASSAMGANPLEYWHGLLLWGALITLSFMQLTRQQYMWGIAGTIFAFFFLSAIVAAGDVGVGQERTYEDAINDPPPSGGEYLNAQEFGIRIGQYLPLVSDLPPADKLELCLDVAEKHFADVTTPQQRKQGCSYYAQAKKEDFQEAFTAFFEYMDKATPTEREEFCKSRGPELFGRGTSKQEADESCTWIANNTTYRYA